MIQCLHLSRDRIAPHVKLRGSDLGVFAPADIVAGLKARIDSGSPCEVCAEDQPGVYGPVVGRIIDAFVDGDNVSIRIEAT